jgi:phosphatidate cytidylyltransferase
VNIAGANAGTAQLSAISNRRNLLFRILSGVVLAPLALLLTFAGGVLFAIAILAVAAGGLREWLRLVTGKTLLWEIIPLGLVLLAYLFSGMIAAFIALGCFAIALALLGPGNKSPVLKAFGAPYIGLTMLSLIWLRDQPGAGWPMVFFLFLIVWGTDIGAFIAGRAIGGARLAPSISPNKTWAGFFGGLVIAAILTFIWTTTVMPASRPFDAAGIAIGLSLCAQGGDLFESAMKRRFNVKDSGDLIPGHGGILDRIDALLWAAPAFALLYTLGLTVSLSP